MQTHDNMEIEIRDQMPLCIHPQENMKSLLDCNSSLYENSDWTTVTRTEENITFTNPLYYIDPNLAFLYLFYIFLFKQIGCKLMCSQNTKKYPHFHLQSNLQERREGVMSILLSWTLMKLLLILHVILLLNMIPFKL